MESLQISYHFSSVLNSTAFALLAAANITMKIHELVYIVIATDIDCVVVEYEYTENGYKEIKERIVLADVKENPKLIRDKILGTSDFKKIILALNNVNGNTAMMKFLRVVLKSKKLIVFDNLDSLNGTYLKEISKWFLDKSYTKYYILPTCFRNYFLTANRRKVLLPILTLQGEKTLPHKQSFTLPGLINKITFGDKNDKASHRFLWKKNAMNTWLL